jgi:hypothetical protein
MPTMPKLPTFELPTLPFDLPSFDLPTLPTCSTSSLPELPTAEQVADAVRDAAYVGVGLAVMTAERAQAAGAKVAELVTAGVARARAATN